MKAWLILFIIYVAGVIYLVQPIPVLPTLDNATLSNEEGDTWQNPDQRGYYTNLTRSQVLNQIQTMSEIKIFGWTVPNYRLNYRPEEAHELIRDQLKSNYMEEIVYPLRSSIFVNGWEPKNSPFYANKPEKEIPDISIYGVPYEAKITLKPNNSHVVSRVLFWSLIFPLSYLTMLSLKKSISHV